jgi:TBC1 domain family member 20
MILLNIDRDSIPRSFKDAIQQCDGFNPSHKYVPIVFRDVERSLWTWIGDPAQRSIWRNHLLNLINAVLNQHQGTLHYYQGYHDIASAVLLSCGVDDGLAILVLERISLNHLRDFMAPQLTETAAQLNLLVPLLKLVESKEMDRPESLASAVEAIEESGAPSFFALSWLLTWASHVIPNVSLATYVVDVMIGHHPALPLYLSAAIVIESRQHGLAALPRPYQMPHVHQYFGTFPVAKANLVKWPQLVQQALKFMNDFPPTKLLQENAAAASIAPTSTLFNYPFPYMSAEDRDDARSAQEVAFSFRGMTVAKKAIGLVSVTSLAAAITAYVYVSSFTGT